MYTLLYSNRMFYIQGFFYSPFLSSLLLKFRFKPTLDYVRSQDGGSILVHQKDALCEIPFDLKAEKIACEFLFELPWIGRVKFDAEFKKYVLKI